MAAIVIDAWIHVDRMNDKSNDYTTTKPAHRAAADHGACATVGDRGDRDVS